MARGTANRQRWYRLAAVAALVAGGLFLTLWQPVSPETLLALGRACAGRPWAAVALVGLQAALLTLALPGSLMVWVVAPLYPPVVAALLLTAGSVAGALGAYSVARWAGAEWPPGPGKRRLVALLAHRGGFSTQLVLRLLPGFPHSVVNYGAGILGLPAGGFLAAAALGLAAKWLIYSAAISNLVAAGVEGEPIGPRTVALLLLLAILFAAGAVIRRRLRRREPSGG
jgi:uncharacterized membrane protein YdjX (TVP38/TMEM64 family)